MAQNTVRFKVVIIGGSAGSLDVVIKIVSSAAALTQTVFIVVVHRKNDAESVLADLLSYKTALKVKEVEDKEPLVPGYLYIAPADYHLLVEDEHSFSLDSSEKIHFSRPSIDVSFASVVTTFGMACIGILLSGANADGAVGLQHIKEAGGYTIVQNPATADVGYMPQQALALFTPDAVLDGEAIGPALTALLKANGEIAN